jgi:predicted NAD/FAD-dependent oxidoreductase
VTSSESQSKQSESLKPNSKNVAIVGGGIAGLTCALRLSQRGYQVTLYEKETMLGGDLSSTHKNGMYHDVYTHLFCDWYLNFWRIVEGDLNIKREEAFEPRMGVKLLDEPSTDSSRSSSETSVYRDFKNPNTLKHILDDFSSGPLPAPDMFLVGFTLLDLAAQPFHPSNLLEQQTVNGFLFSRPYVTTDCADLHNTILNEIWCISSNDTSAAAYQGFVRRVLASRGLPFAWLLRGSLQEMLIAPWHERLKNCQIRTSVEIKEIEVSDSDQVQLTLGDNAKATHANVVMAVPAPELAKLVMTGSPGRRLVDRVPVLSELQRLRTASILVLTLVFKEKLPNIPREPVGLARSRGYLTFIDISQLWISLNKDKQQHTVLILAASDAYAYPSGRTDEEWAHLMIQELARYLPGVKPGHRWGAADGNIDYSRSWPQNNHSRTLFLNDMNSEEFPRKAWYPELGSVFFAGDFCPNEVKMATVEAATLSGLHAARAVQTKVEGASDITVASGVIPSSREFLAMKLGLLPVAYAATAWAAADGVLRNLAKGESSDPEERAASFAALALLPVRYVADWLASLESLGIALVAPGRESDGSISLTQHKMQSCARGMVAAKEFFSDIASGRSAGKPRGLVAFLTEVLRAIETASSSQATAAASASHSPAGESQPRRGSGRYRPYGYVRRHRAKF